MDAHSIDALPVFGHALTIYVLAMRSISIASYTTHLMTLGVLLMFSSATHLEVLLALYMDHDGEKRWGVVFPKKKVRCSSGMRDFKIIGSTFLKTYCVLLRTPMRTSTLCSVHFHIIRLLICCASSCAVDLALRSMHASVVRQKKMILLCILCLYAKVIIRRKSEVTCVSKQYHYWCANYG